MAPDPQASATATTGWHWCLSPFPPNPVVTIHCGSWPSDPEKEKPAKIFKLLRLGKKMGSPISQNTFLQRARARFADHYDYSQILYKSYKTPIQIRCKLHPVKLISITPEKHLQTSGGCKYCLRESRIRMLERELHRDSAIRATQPETLQIKLQEVVPGS
jgi:hypothetical protein